jgi:hypothetical protein
MVSAMVGGVAAMAGHTTASEPDVSAPRLQALSADPSCRELISILAAIPAYVEITRVRGLVSVQVTNLLLLGPVLLLLRRWRPPFGAATLLFAMVAALVAVVDEFARWEVVAAALAGGLAADWLIARSARWPNRARAHRTVAIGTPLVLWASYFLAVQLRWGIAWPAELWAGSVVFGALGGFALSLLMVPPPAPPAPGGPEEA